MGSVPVLSMDHGKPHPVGTRGHPDRFAGRDRGLGKVAGDRVAWTRPRGDRRGDPSWGREPWSMLPSERDGRESSLTRMPVEWELLERQFETRKREKRRDRAASRLPDPRPRQRPRHRPPLPSWLSGHGSEGYNRSLLKQPCPYPLTPDPRSFRHLTSICEDQDDDPGEGSGRPLPTRLARPVRPPA